MIHSREIRCFLAAADHPHFSEAAKQPHISQPEASVSKLVSVLEDKFKSGHVPMARVSSRMTQVF